MTVIKAYNELPTVRAHNLESGGASISVEDGDVSISLAFADPAILHRFANAVARAVANIEPTTTTAGFDGSQHVPGVPERRTDLNGRWID